MTTQRRRSAVLAASGAFALGLSTLMGPAAMAAPTTEPTEAVVSEPLPERVEVGEAGEPVEEPADEQEPAEGQLFEATLSAAVPADVQVAEQNIEDIAAASGVEVPVAESLLGDETVRVSTGGHIYFAEPVNENPQSVDAVPSGAVPGNPTEGSLPGSDVTIWLDFGGGTVEDTQWNTEEGVESIDYAASNYVDDEDAQQVIWEIVAEDYAPFDVNVTTENPGADALYKDGEDDPTYGAHVALVGGGAVGTPTEDFGGLAFVGGFGVEPLQPAWANEQAVGDDPYAIGVVVSHEVGHNLGLVHAGIENDQGSFEYYYPAPATLGGSVWGPIMGGPYSSPITQWTDYQYGGYRSGEAPTPPAGYADELTEMTAPDPIDVGGGFFTERLDFRGDDHGDVDDPTRVILGDDGTIAGEGVIEQTDDVDAFEMLLDEGPLEIAVAGTADFANLDVELALLDGSGEPVDGATVDNPEITVEEDPENPALPIVSGLDSTVTFDVPGPGAYLLTVTGTGFGDTETVQPIPDDFVDTGVISPSVEGYSSYGSLGNYELTGSATALDVEPLVVTSPENGAELEREPITVTGTGTPGADVEIAFGGETFTATVDEEGAFSVEIGTPPFGPSDIVVTQSLGDIELDTLTVSISVVFEALAITSPEDGAEVEQDGTVVTGVGEPGLEVEVTVNTEVVGTTEIDENGEWTYEVNGLRFGQSTLIAVQAVGDLEGAEDSITVVVPFGAPVIVRPEDGDVANSPRPTFSGTGIPGAEVTLVLNDEEAATVTVDDEGNWEWVPEADLPEGDHVIFATQFLNGITSEPSAEVSFSVDLGGVPPEDDEDGDVGGEDGGDNGDDDLPDTGFGSAGLLGLAALLAAGGAGAVFVTRRRNGMTV